MKKYKKCIDTIKNSLNSPTIRRLFKTNCLSVFDHSVGLSLKGFKAGIILIFVKIILGEYIFCRVAGFLFLV